MAEVRLSLPPANIPLVDADGRAPLTWRRFLEGVFRRLGGSTDSVFAALVTSLSGLSAIEVVASGGLQFGGTASGGPIPVSLYVAIDQVANLPTGVNPGDWAFATDGRNSGEGAAAGTGCPVVWSGSAWRIPGVSTAVAA